MSKQLKVKKEFVTLKINYLLNFLKHLETFLCDFYLENLHIDDHIGIDHFCARLEEIFASQEGANKKSFKFALLVNPSEWDYGDR
jgi:hypothetical protein